MMGNLSQAIKEGFGAANTGSFKNPVGGITGGLHSITDGLGMTTPGGGSGGGKKGSKTAATPDYTGAALATANSGKYDQTTPYGSVNWTLRPGADPKNPQPGDYIQTTQLSQGQQGVYDQSVANRLGTGMAAGSVLGDLSHGTQGVQDALYNKSTQYYDKNFGDQRKALESQLANQGITQGSEAYNNAFDQYNQNRNKAYETATNDAITGATSQQGQLVQQLAALLGGSQPTVPQSSGGTAGADFTSALGSQANNALASSNAQAAQSAQQQQMLASLAMAAATAFSDIRLKSSIVQVGTGFAGLPAYEYEIFGRRERGYMAHEVAERFPAAVSVHESGFFRVDYSQLGGRP
jgi:hypothetical protein